jgi:two-component system, chemotaxis family, response regulator PixG
MNITSQTNVKFKDLIAEFNHIKTDTFSGNLIIQVADTPNWMLYFSAGLLAGISGGIDAIDRWKRNLALASLKMPLDRLIKSTNDREIFLNANKIAQECVAKEVLFDIIQFSQNKGDRLSYRFIPVSDKNTQVQSALPLLEIQPILTATIQSWQKWSKYGLESYEPSLFPIIQDSTQVASFADDKDLQHLIASIDGTKSLRSLAIQHHKHLIDVIMPLLPLLKLNIISLSPSKHSSAKLASHPDRKLDSGLDLDSSANGQSPQIEISVPAHGLQNRTISKAIPLIACIDDSMSVYISMEKIITDYGYRCFGIQDPLKIITGLIRNKPDLIFLDLVMPVTNGYEVCEQIRKTPSLANIPIVILTGNDGLIDRVRTKFVGANGFLGKPIQGSAVTKMIDKYLEDKQSNRITTTKQSDPISIVETGLITQQRQTVLNNIGKQVLVVDDDRNIREVVSMCLHKLKGWDVLTAASGQEGLNGIEIKNPDVIILDVMMPEMDGLAFLRQLRSNPDTKQIPVILLTANRYLPDKSLLTELGVVETISKPFLPVNLVRQIDKALLN